ncbi:MAG: hypothetical protein LBE13_15300 [Bacteroidales bacterium]|jgi:hypothetical protein|nr:hypothetical protein [Bacteroidales bacterium]
MAETKSKMKKILAAAVFVTALFAAQNANGQTKLNDTVRHTNTKYYGNNGYETTTKVSTAGGRKTETTTTTCYGNVETKTTNQSVGASTSGVNASVGQSSSEKQDK